MNNTKQLRADDTQRVENKTVPNAVRIITQMPTIASVRGSLCGQDVVRSRRACFVCDLFRIGSITRTVCRGDRGASSFAVRSWYDSYTFCRCWIIAFTSPFDRDDTALRFHLYLLPFRSSHRMAGWGCPETQHLQVTAGTAFLRLCEKPFHSLRCCPYESIRPRIHRRACNVIEPVSYNKDPKLFRAVLRAIIGDQPFRNSMLLEDSFEMIDDSASADVCQFSYDRKFAV